MKKEWVKSSFGTKNGLQEFNSFEKLIVVFMVCPYWWVHHSVNYKISVNGRQTPKVQVPIVKKDSAVSKNLRFCELLNMTTSINDPQGNRPLP